MADRDEALQRMLLALCLDEGAEDAYRRDPAAFARAVGVDERDAAVLSTEGRRLPLYRRLVRSALGGIVRDVLGPFVPRLEHEAPGLFASCLDAFLAAGPRAPLLRELPRVFFEASRARLAGDDRVPAWLVEAGDVLLTEHQVGAAPDPEPLAETELALDRGLRFSPARAVRHYAFTVPLLELDDLANPASPVPQARAAAWLVLRGRDDALGWRELSPPAATFLERALAGDTLGDAMAAVRVAHVCAEPTDLQQELTDLLGELAAEGVLLGGRR